jgi:hypothetical protein
MVLLVMSLKLKLNFHPIKFIDQSSKLMVLDGENLFHFLSVLGATKIVETTRGQEKPLPLEPFQILTFEDTFQITFDELDLEKLTFVLNIKNVMDLKSKVKHLKLSFQPKNDFIFTFEFEPNKAQFIKFIMKSEADI